MLKKPKIKPTFYNTRNGRFHWNYQDTNNYLFIIFFDTGATLGLVLRDLKKDKNIVKYIYNKLNTIFDNIAEIETTKITFTEYLIYKQNKIPSVIKLC